MADPAGPPLDLRFVAGPDVDALDVSRAEILAAVEGAVRAQGEGRVVLEPRVHLAPPNGGAGHFNVLRGHLGPEHVSGIKVVGDFVGNWRLGLPSELALVLLLDPDTGVPLGIVDGTMLTAARTGALTALGARHLARPDSRVLGHLGARGSAWWNVTMLDDLFDFEEIRVTSRRAESREAFAARLAGELGKPVRAVGTPEEALAGADIMVEATRLTEPEVLLATRWVTPGTTVIPYGTVSAVDLDLVDVMDKVVVDDWGQAGAGPQGASGPRSGRCSGTGGWPPPTSPWPGCCSTAPPRPVAAPCYATADLDVPAGMLCVVRDLMADFEVVATAAGQCPAEDRGIT